MKKIFKKTAVIMVLLLFSLNLRVLGVESFDNKTRVQILNTGQSDAILILSNNFNMIIDTGTKAQSYKLINQLKNEQISKVDYLILTHYHDDHYGGLQDVLKSVKVDKVLLPEFCVNMEEKDKVMDIVKNSKVKFEYVKSGWSINHNDINLRAIAPTKPSKFLENNNSLVLVGEIANLKYLFMADAERDLEKQVMKNKDIRYVDVMKVAHHGIGSGTYKDFLNKVRPSVAIVTSDGVESPNGKVIKNLTDLKCNVFRTDQYGDIMIVSEKDNEGIVHLQVYSRKSSER